jgi:hypothetical protein
MLHDGMARLFSETEMARKVLWLRVCANLYSLKLGWPAGLPETAMESCAQCKLCRPILLPETLMAKCAHETVNANLCFLKL